MKSEPFIKAMDYPHPVGRTIHVIDKLKRTQQSEARFFFGAFHPVQFEIDTFA